MKKITQIFYTLVVGVMATVMTACSSDVIPYGATLLGSYKITAPSSVVFGPSGEEKQITITSDVDWHIYGWSGYFDYYPSDGEPGSTTVTLTSEATDETEDREYEIEVYSYRPGIESRTIRLKREGVKLKVNSSENYVDDITIPQTGGTCELRIESNAEWTITTPDSWLSCPVRSGSKNQNVTISAGVNTGDTRSCVFYVKAGQASIWVYVSQAGLARPTENDNPRPSYASKR